MVIYIVLLAMVAGFLALRLYSVLGKRTGHEQPLVRAVDERPAPQPLPRPIETTPEPRDAEPKLMEQRAQVGLRALVAADPSFDVHQFLDGAKGAYRMILEAFWKSDEETLGWLVEDHVRQAFIDAIAANRAQGHVLDNRLVSIERALIVDAQVETGVTRVTVAFDADIAAVTRDAAGVVVAGSLTDAVATHDVWTFARALKSRDPNWKLADTDEA